MTLKNENLTLDSRFKIYNSWLLAFSHFQLFQVENKKIYVGKISGGRKRLNRKKLGKPEKKPKKIEL